MRAMRENIRSKRQPFQVSLGVKQVGAVLAVALLGVGAAFALGLGVGHKSSAAPAEPVAAPRDPLARLDEPLTAKEEPPPELKAHQALTDSRSIDKTMPVPAVNVAADKAAATAAPRVEEKVAPEAEVVMPPAIAAPGPAPLPAVPLATPPAAQPLPVQAAPASAASAKPKLAGTAKPTPAAKPDLTRSAHAARGATSKAAQPARRVAKETKPLASRSAAQRSKGKGAYTIQIASAQHRSDAERAARRVAARRPRIVTADVPGKGRWYRVQIGSYDSRESARVALLSMSGVHGVVTPVR